jgi:uncharacterized membrane protein YgdD (TMEM256/DUF423 family)
MTGSRGFLATGGLLLAFATVIGALGAHALQTRLTALQLDALRTAVDYQFFHALGLLAVGALVRDNDSRWLRASGALLVAGIVGFSGGIYIMLAGAPRALGLITPLGGLLLIAAWLAFTVAVLRR